ncbi:IS701 family transposase [Streptomyces sp. NPDC054783]
MATGRVASRFARYEPRLRARRLALGLMSDLPRKMDDRGVGRGGQPVRPATAVPGRLGRRRRRRPRDADAVRDDVRAHIVEHLHDEAAVLVVDETGDVKKGTHTVAVQRQYTGAVGRTEDAQVADYLVYAGERGHGAVDRELYIPHSWTRDPDRCQAAGLGEDTVFVTKPELARTMIERFLDAGHHVGWVTRDEVYGGKPTLRAALEEVGIDFVLAVACSAQGSGKTPVRRRADLRSVPPVQTPRHPLGTQNRTARRLLLPLSPCLPPLCRRRIKKHRP